jgi:hypothetical protein
VTARRISRRSSRPGPRRLRLAATTLLAGVAALATITACGSGQYAQTANQVPGVPGANVNIGPGGTIQMRNVVVAYNNPAGYPAGASAPLIVRIFNGGQTTIGLTGVDAAGSASTVALTSGSATAAEPTAPAPTLSPAGQGTGSPTAPAPSPTAAATASPTAAPTTTAPAPPKPSGFPVNIPPGTWADLVPGQGQYLLLTGLTNALRPGDNVPVTFHFSDGTVATVQVPVDLPTTQASLPVVQPSEGEPQPHG